jgi:hypothetical protein
MERCRGVPSLGACLPCVCTSLNQRRLSRDRANKFFGRSTRLTSETLLRGTSENTPSRTFVNKARPVVHPLRLARLASSSSTTAWYSVRTSLPSNHSM